MKLFKKGFTLAELMLVIGIIAIVTAMGAAITKKSTEKAYNLYYYTGYVNLYNAFTDTRMNDGKTEPNQHGAGDCQIQTNHPVCHLNNLLGTGPYNGEMDFTIISKNGIRYQFISDNLITGLIIMGVPQPKTRTNPSGMNYVVIRANINSGNIPAYEYLIPVSQSSFAAVGNALPNGTYIDLGERQDLLPTYIDNGTVGRVLSDLGANANTSYTNIRYTTYNQAVCSINNNALLRQYNGNIILDCSKINVPASVGVMRFGDPRKVR